MCPKLKIRVLLNRRRNLDTAEFLDLAAGILDYPVDTDLIGSER